MGEDACYLALVGPDGRLREGPVIPWPIDADQEPPPGAQLVVRTDDLENETRLQLFLNTARERRLILLHAPENCDKANALAELIAEGLEKK